MTELKERLLQTASELEQTIQTISTHLFNNPELSGEEFKSVSFLASVMKSHGFSITESYCGLPTAFLARKGTGDGPVIAFLAEYDALPGFGPDQKPAHACGHNWLAAASCGAAIVLAKAAEQLSGEILLIGTPAEETTGGKVDMVQAGAFDGIDAVLQMHLENATMLNTRALAMDAIEFSFKGMASHAAQYPHEGINALDAVNLTFAGINALRQHVKPDIRIHGIVTQGGQAPNIVPETAACQFYIRANERSELNMVTEKVINCARGAGLMTGAALSHNYYENHFDNLYNNPILQQTVLENMKWAGISDISMDPEEFPGSSDIGNVSHRAPTVYATLGIGQGPSVHEEGFLEAANGPAAVEQLKKAVLSMAGTALDILENPTLAASIASAHRQRS